MPWAPRGPQRRSPRRSRRARGRRLPGRPSRRVRVAARATDGSQRELRSHPQEQDPEEPPKDALVDSRRDLDSELRADDGDGPDQERRSNPQVAERPLPRGAHGSCRNDREERRRPRLDLPEPEEDERRDEQDPSADPEDAREDARAEAEAERGRDRPTAHPTISQTPTTTSNPAKASVRTSPERRCCSCVPASAPATAGSPTSAAYAGRTSPRAA